MFLKLLKSGGSAQYLNYGNLIFVSLTVEANAIMPAASLTKLQQQIAQREQELQTLREQLQTQQSQFAELTRRKEELLSDLRQVEDEIAALASLETKPTEQAASAAPAAPPSPARHPRGEDQPRLADLIVTILRESTSPMTGRQLLEERSGVATGRRVMNHSRRWSYHLQVLKGKGVIHAPRASMASSWPLPPTVATRRKVQPVDPHQ